MRIALLLIAAVFSPLVGCGKAEKGPAATSAGPNTQGPPRPAEITELLGEAAKSGGYENTFGNADSAIVKLQFRSPGPKDADLEKLRPLIIKSPIPIGLNLSGCESITDVGVAHLEGIRNIRELALDSKKITEEGIKQLTGLVELEKLYLSNDAIDDKWLAHLGKLTKLKSLSLYSKGVTDAGYSHLAPLTALEEITVGGIGHDIGDECLGHMKGMTKLKELSIGGKKLTDAGMKYVGNFVELRKMRIDGDEITALGVAYLAPLKKLQVLTALRGKGFTGDALAALKDMSELRELELIYTPALDKAGGKQIGKLTGLKKLRLGHVENGALEGLAGLTGLEELDLNYSSVGDADLKNVTGLTGLKRLDVQHTRVTDEGLKFLVGMPGLLDLSASGNKITDAGLVHLSGIPNLENISLWECKITGSGFKELARLTKLKKLGISGNPVTDAHVINLKDISRLTEVDFAGTKVSDEAALALKQARPEIRVRDVIGDEVSLEKKPPTRSRPPVEDLSKVEPAFKMTAEEFFKEYEAGKNTAAEKYKGKVIELSGEIDGIGRNFGGDPYVTLKVEKQLLGVMCFTAEEHPWAKVVRGQKIKIKGKWPEFTVASSLIYCAFVETGEYAGIRLSAEELAKEYAADPEATVKKYDKKFLVMTGEVVSKEFNSAGAASVELKSGNKVKVKCSFTATEKDVTKPIKVGQTIEVVGEFTLNFAGGNDVGIYFCLPMPKP